MDPAEDVHVPFEVVEWEPGPDDVPSGPSPFDLPEDVAALRQSALDKLQALGLTEDEARAIAGF